MAEPFVTVTFERDVEAPASVLWHVWTAPPARAVWAPPSPAVTVEFLEADTRAGGREVSICKFKGEPDTRCDVGWLAIEAGRRTVNAEVVSRDGTTLSAALVTAVVSRGNGVSRIVVTVQLASLAEDMEEGYRQGFGAGMDHLADVARRTMVIQRAIAAPRSTVWNAWMNPETLPKWWGPDGFSCRTKRIDLRKGGHWVFDMIAADGTVWPNHHIYGEVRLQDRIAYTLLWGENGPKHADAWVVFEEHDGSTMVTLGMIFRSAEEFDAAKGFGAEALGLQTLGKLARFIGAK